MDDVSLHFCCLLCFVCLFHFIGCYLVAEYRLKSGLDSGLWTLDRVCSIQSPESRVYSPESSPDFILCPCGCKTCQTLIRFL